MGVQRRTVSHFKGLFKTFKMRYSTFLYSYWIGLHVHFKKAILLLKMAKGTNIKSSECMVQIYDRYSLRMLFNVI